MASNKLAKPKSKINTRKQRNLSAEPATVLKIQQAAKWLAEGKSRATIIERLMDEYQITAKTASVYYADAIRFLLPEEESEYKNELIKANITRLETIYERAMASGDYKNAREAVQELNKMAGVSKDGITVGINTDKANDTQQVVIRFDK